MLKIRKLVSQTKLFGHHGGLVARACWVSLGTSRVFENEFILRVLISTCKIEHRAFMCAVYLVSPAPLCMHEHEISKFERSLLACWPSTCMWRYMAPL